MFDHFSQRAAPSDAPLPFYVRCAKIGPPTARRTLLRAADIAVAASLLLLTLPLAALVALAVRLDSPGPVLSRLPRRGRGGRGFHLLAFRSTAPGPRGRHVPTRVGRLLRPARLDQLPVLLNLLRGDMTLVGPAPVEAQAYSGQALARPGVTGWAAAD